MSDDKNKKLDTAGVLYVLGGIPTIAAFFIIYFILSGLGIISG